MVLFFFIVPVSLGVIGFISLRSFAGFFELRANLSWGEFFLLLLSYFLLLDLSGMSAWFGKLGDEVFVRRYFSVEKFSSIAR